MFFMQVAIVTFDIQGVQGLSKLLTSDLMIKESGSSLNTQPTPTREISIRILYFRKIILLSSLLHMYLGLYQKLLHKTLLFYQFSNSPNV